MESRTVNEFLVLKKVFAERKNDLKQIRLQTTVKTKTTRRYNDETTEETVDPQYDTKAIDRRVTEIQNAELAIDSAIKQSNATTILNVNVDVEKLLSPME
jgi:hypothetical protein